MSRINISAAFRREVQAQETGEVFAILVTIDHEDLPQPLRLNTAGVNLISRGQTFLACFLEATIVDDDPDRPPQARLVVSNIDRAMVSALRSTLKPCSVLLEVVRASDPDYVEAAMDNLEMRNINYDSLVVQGDLLPQKIHAQPAIDYGFTPSYFPGLF